MRAGHAHVQTHLNLNAEVPMPTSRRELIQLGMAHVILLQAGCKGGGLEPVDSGDSGRGDSGMDTGDSGLEECLASSPQSPGPFYVSDPPVLSDLRDVHAGSPLEIRITLIDAATCLPMAGIPIDLWHANVAGLYSDVDNSVIVEGLPETFGQDWFRGRQVSDADGVVRFTTHYPGWYPSAPPHLHFTSSFGDRQNHTWQFYLDDAFSERVYTEVADYAERGAHVRKISDAPNLPEDLILEPAGTPDNASIDVVVAVDLESLTFPPKPFGS